MNQSKKEEAVELKGHFLFRNAGEEMEYHLKSMLIYHKQEIDCSIVAIYRLSILCMIHSP